jgi:hypothetical protein
MKYLMVVNDLMIGWSFQQKVQESVGLLAMFTYIVKKDAGVLLNKCIFLSSTVLSNLNYEFKEISTILGDDIPK